MSDVEFIDGLIVRPKRDGAPDFIKCCLSIRRTELIAWLQERDGDWVNVDIKESKGGKLYAAVNNFKPGARDERPAKATKPEKESAPISDDIPF